MGRIVVPIFLAVTLLGCGHSSPSPKTLEWYNAQTQKWVESVVSSCAATHSNYADGKSAVDCVTDDALNLLTMSFPDFDTFKQHGSGVAEFLEGWCSSVGSHTGRLPRVKLVFRETESEARGRCKERK